MTLLSKILTLGDEKYKKFKAFINFQIYLMTKYCISH